MAQNRRVIDPGADGPSCPEHRSMPPMNPEHRSMPPMNNVMRTILMVTVVVIGTVLARNITTAIQDAISVETTTASLPAPSR